MHVAKHSSSTIDCTALAKTTSRMWPSMTIVLVPLLGAIIGANAYENSVIFPVGAQRPASGQPATAVKEVKLSCLNSFAGPPFNYKMRCPDTANITEYYDKKGARHRIIRHAPVPGVTAAMVRWWFSPGTILAHPFLQFNNETIYWYKLWHPIDHEFVIPVPGLELNTGLPWIYVYVEEHYRPAPGDIAKKGYQVQAATFVADARISVQFRAPGGAILASFVNRPWRDSPEGMIFETELIIAVDVQPAFVSRTINKLLTIPTTDTQLPNLDDQLTRHHIEEVGNWQFFLPEVYKKYAVAKKVYEVASG